MLRFFGTDFCFGYYITEKNFQSIYGLTEFYFRYLCIVPKKRNPIEDSPLRRHRLQNKKGTGKESFSGTFWR